MDPRFESYGTWIHRRRRIVLGVAGVLGAVAAAAAIGLPLRTDLSTLLPPEARSVRDLDRIERRAAVLGTALCAVESDQPALRARAVERLSGRLRQLDPTLVERIIVDDQAARQFAWDHRFLFASLGDLEAARDALAARIRRAALAANPLFVPLDDGDREAGDPAARPLDKLRKQLDDAELRSKRPEALLSSDGRLQLIVVQAPFPSAVVARGERLVAALNRAVDDTVREVGPGVSIGITEDVVIAVAEHRAILQGMALAVVLTVVIVGLSLWLYYRSLAALGALLGSLAVGTLVTFGLTRLAIGYLNSVTAFLSSIVVGNGINFGIIVLARHMEERGEGAPASLALARALGGSLTGTLAAALAAGVAYASLIVTDFRGFRHFGLIGGIGMLLCWASAYTVLPALLAELEHRGLIRPRPRRDAWLRSRPYRRWLAATLAGRPGRVVAVGAVVLVAATGVTVRYLAADAFEYDWQRMRSNSPEATLARAWMQRIDGAFGRQIVGGFVIAAGDATRAAVSERILREHAEDAPGTEPDRPLFRSVESLQALVPGDQPAKLGVLAELRRLVDHAGELALADDALAEARRFRPPDDLRALTMDDVPPFLASRFLERDGTRGRLLFANQASRFDGWNGRDMIAFARAVRGLDFPSDTLIGGGAFVFADILQAVARAGPRATLVALIGVVAFVVIVVGRGRLTLVTLLCLAVGTVTMTACAALLGLKVNFLDFVALPITLGIGVDYAVNVVARRDDPRGATRQAVMLCSWTTTVGYGSLLLSGNAGIVSFGLTAILGEATCLVAALTLAPALLAVLPPQSRSRPPPTAMPSETQTPAGP